MNNKKIYVVEETWFYTENGTDYQCAHNMWENHIFGIETNAVEFAEAIANASNMKEQNILPCYCIKSWCTETLFSKTRHYIRVYEMPIHDTY